MTFSLSHRGTNLPIRVDFHSLDLREYVNRADFVEFDSREACAEVRVSRQTLELSCIHFAKPTSAV